MAKDREKNLEHKNQIEAVPGEEEEDDENFVVAEPPECPNCGFHNTRPSYTRTILDRMLRTFSLRPFRCRSCGNRFRVRRASPD